MIKYRLACGAGHEFEGWFQSGEAYDMQEARGQITCPHCGTADVGKAIMAPSVATARRSEERAGYDGKPSPREVQRLMRKLRQEIEAKAEYVGPRFAEEARKLHEQEGEPRGIYGEATPDEAASLAEDGIPFFPMPRLPEDLN